MVAETHHHIFADILGHTRMDLGETPAISRPRAFLVALAGDGLRDGEHHERTRPGS
ncbi:hypothetical protein BZL30_5955 [Mycobacterium kansasii]|uniref:Uncharacterized protein n=1 Tax=Mycobacterium kansasii TaxID=1768 RepID=A0A1V3WYY5_MYCKA|nr:hypothetical protein BZL30_5955 [Mycobacterium kansasii]